MKTMIFAAWILTASHMSFAQINESDKIYDPIEYIKKETVGGKLDFDSVLVRNHKDITTINGFFLYDGFAYNKKDYAIFLWGQAVKRIGVSTSKKATKLWEEIKGRSMTSPEKKALIRGFDTEIK
jgi:hypothetical protein